MNNSDNKEIELIGIDLDFEEIAGSGKEPDPVVTEKPEDTKEKRSIVKEVLSYVVVITIALIVLAMEFVGTVALIITKLLTTMAITKAITITRI